VFQGEPVFALIVAAGQSQRMGVQDKIFAPLAGAPLLARTVEAFLQSPLVDQIVVVLREERLDAGLRLAEERDWPGHIVFCGGGERRQDSVQLGLHELAEEGWVLIHDGARPFVTPELVRRGLEAAGQTQAAVPVLPLKETVKQVSDAGLVERTLPRHALRTVQTPQVFRLGLIRKAHRHFAGSGQTFTDDAALLEAIGYPVAVFPGKARNIKVTTPEDLVRAEQLWKKKGHDDGRPPHRSGL
jgi:2-C-methyl-D-erythritol 4-phosphate cytidylyltransferase